MTIYSFDSESSEGVICDIYVKRNNKTKSRLEIMFEKPEKVNEFIGLKPVLRNQSGAAPQIILDGGL